MNETELQEILHEERFRQRSVIDLQNTPAGFSYIRHKIPL